jgi:hypothetical protein
MLQLRINEVSDEFDLSAVENLVAASVVMALSVLSENEMKQRVLLASSSEERVERFK